VEGSDKEERLDMLLVSSSSSSSSWLAWDLVRFRLTVELRGKGVGGFVFFVLLSERSTLTAVVLIGVGFDDAVRPAVTFLMALMPAVLLVGFATMDAGAGGGFDADTGASAGSVGGNGRVGGGAAGICIVI